MTHTRHDTRRINLQGLQMGNSYSCWKLLHLVLLVGLDNGQVVSELGEC